MWDVEVGAIEDQSQITNQFFKQAMYYFIRIFDSSPLIKKFSPLKVLDGNLNKKTTYIWGETNWRDFRIQKY